MVVAKLTNLRFNRPTGWRTRDSWSLDDWDRFLETFGKQHAGWLVNVFTCPGGKKCEKSTQVSGRPLEHTTADWKGPRPEVQISAAGYVGQNARQDGVFDDQPGGMWAAIWQQGAGISADPSGRVYADSGEGSFSAGLDLPVSIFGVAQGTRQLSLSQWFTPYNWQALNTADADLNNAVLILPTQTGLHPYEAVTAGKRGTIYLLDRENMGHICSTCTAGDTQIVQELINAVPESGSPTFWNKTLYFTGGAAVEAYKVSQGLPVSPPSVTQVAGGGHTIITANGTEGILWSLSTAGVLWAMDARTLKVLYTSRKAALTRDVVPTTAHFATPMAADGKVFIGTRTSLVVYGLLP